MRGSLSGWARRLVWPAGDKFTVTGKRAAPERAISLGPPQAKNGPWPKSGAERRRPWGGAVPGGRRDGTPAGFPGRTACPNRSGLGGLHGGALAERFVPGGGGGVSVAPVQVGEAEIQVTQCAADGDDADVQPAFQRCGMLFNQRKAVADLAQLAIDPAVPAQRLRAQRGFIAGQQGGAHHAVGHRLLGQHLPARAVGREQCAASQIVQVFAHHAAVEDRLAIVGNEGGHLAQRVAGDDGLVAGDGAGGAGQLFDAVGQAELMRDDHAFADEWRSGRVEDLHGGPCRHPAEGQGRAQRNAGRRVGAAHHRLHVVAGHVQAGDGRARGVHGLGVGVRRDAAGGADVAGVDLDRVAGAVGKRSQAGVGLVLRIAQIAVRATVAASALAGAPILAASAANAGAWIR
ncbi:hypothetical protein G6F65_015823 [Rhizopus arrhizus]|nr:hypothetical protein G6F65_015823 [Rhizopus arrhizus]